MKRFVLILACLLSLNLTVLGDDNKSENNMDDIIENENRYEKLIELSRFYITNNTEYAFNCAYKASMIADKENDKKKSAECNMLIGDIFKRNKSYPNAVSYYEKAIEDLIHLKDYNTIYKLYIKIAQLYQNSEFDNKWSFDALNKASDFAKKTDSKNAINEIQLAYGDIYLSQKEYDKAISYYNQIIKSPIQKNNIPMIANAMSNKAKTYIKKENYTSALHLIDSSLYLCIRDFNDSLQIINYNYKAEIYDSLNETELAKKYYKQAATLAYSIEDYENCGKNMYSIGILNKKKNKIDDAINIFKILCDSAQRFNMYDYCYLSYYQLSQCYANLQMYKKAYELFNKYDIYYDSTYKRKQEEKMEELRTSYILSLNMKELKLKENELIKKENTKLNWIVLIGILIATITMIIIYITFYSKNKEMNHKNKESVYEQQLKIDQMENDLMEYQLKSNRESLVNLSLHLKSYMDFINPLKNELKEIIDLPESEQKNRIKNIYANMQNNIQLFSNTDNLQKQIDAIYKDFLNRLEEKYPNLTKSEKKLCAMLYVEMSSKEIAVITNTTTRSVETSRYRLRKKFNLSREEDIISFLRNI